MGNGKWEEGNEAESHSGTLKPAKIFPISHFPFPILQAFRASLFLILLVVSVGVLPAPVFAQQDYEKELAAQRKELDAVRSKLLREQRELATLKTKKTATIGQLKKLEDNITETNRYMARLEAAERILDASVRNTRGDLREIEDRLETRSEILARRARLLYMAGRPEDLLFLPSSGEASFLERAHMVRRLLEYDRRLVGENRRDMGLKQEGLKKLLVQSAELEDFQKRKQREMATFTSARNDQEKTLKTLTRDEAAKAKALKQLEENAKKLDAIIRALEKRRQDGLASGRKGRELETGTRYCAPVQGKVVSRYGLQHHATLGTSTRNLGIEIDASAGTPVRAAVSGEVAMITAIPGYGRGIILDNGSGYFTIYANLSGVRVSVGDAVNTCQEMAALAASPGSLYFEVRRGTKTLDPEAWLKGGGK
jgi:septal ring factor EnvC (AmiA/AmiB activator)